MPLPAACNGVDPCNDVNCQKEIAKSHQIQDAEFQQRIIASAGNPKTITALDMQNILDAGICGTDVVAFNQNADSNSELEPIITPNKGHNVAYSFPLFKGILADSPDAFNYYLATGSSGSGRDVIFSVTFSGEPERYYDDSDKWP